jgi:predicted MFS family arabinose efflux permease
VLHFEPNSSQRMNTIQVDKIDKATSRALLLLSLAYFIQGTTYLSIIGAFEFVSAEWQLSPAQTATLVSTFGATFAIAAPVLQVLVGHLPRRTQILVGLSVMAFGTISFVVAPNYPSLFATRIVAGLGAALISPVLSALGSTLVPPSQQGRALAIVVMGVSIATVVGVPASAWIAGYIGPRWLFVLIASLTIVTAGLIACLIRDRSSGGRVSPRQFIKLIQQSSTLSGLSVSLFTVAGIFATYTMIAPIMHDCYGASPGMVSAGLLIYGVAGFVGNLFVRRASAVWPAYALIAVSVLVLIAIFAALLLLPRSLGILLAALILWPFVCDIVWPSQQRRMVELEPAFRGIVLAFNASFMFTGVALGSFLGGISYPIFGFSSVLALSILLLSLAFGALKYSERSRLIQLSVTSSAL